MRHFILRSLIIATYAVFVAATVLAAPKDMPVSPEPTAQHASLAHAFDFYEGSWSVRMRKRKVDGNLHVRSAWLTFSASVTVRRVLDGTAFIEQYDMNVPEGHKQALGSRLYDAKTNRWAIYWTNQNDGAWQPPAVGGALTNDGIEIVYKDSIEGQPVLTRYKWISHDVNYPVWEQAFSNDRGTTWLANWTMSFSRVGKRE